MYSYIIHGHVSVCVYLHTDRERERERERQRDREREKTNERNRQRERERDRVSAIQLEGHKASCAAVGKMLYGKNMRDCCGIHQTCTRALYIELCRSLQHFLTACSIQALPGNLQGACISKHFSSWPT